MDTAEFRAHPPSSASSASSASRASSTTPLWLGIGLSLLIFLLARPHQGLMGDAPYYLAEILRRVHPVLNADLFFAYGSQGTYTLYPSLMAPLYQWMTIATVQVLVLGLSRGLCGWAIVRLLRDQGSTRAWMGLMCVLALHSYYGGFGTLKFFEDTLTARTLAEPLVLWGLVFLLEERRASAALGLLVAAAMLHPLVALPAWVIAWIELQQRDKRWRWALLSIPVVVVLAWVGVAPFNGLFHRYDPDWWRVVLLMDRQTVYANWQWSDWQRTVVDALLLLAASAWASSRLAGLLRSTLIAVVALMLVGAIGGDWARSQLITGLQLWRVLWLAHLLAFANLPLVLSTLWQRDVRLGLWRLATALVACVVVASDGSYWQGWVLLVAAGSTMLAARRQLRVSPTVLRLAAGGAVLCMLGMDMSAAFYVAGLWRGGAYTLPIYPPLWILLLRLPAVCLPLAFVSMRAWQFQPKARFLVVTGLALALLIAGSQWDCRSDWTKLLEQGSLEREHPFDRVIEPSAQVYWHQDLVPSWLLLGRVVYFGEGQGAGALFNQNVAREYYARWHQFLPLLQQAELCRNAVSLMRRPEAMCVTPSLQSVRELCIHAVQLDYLVFREPLGVPFGSKDKAPEPLATWDPHLQAESDLNFYLYGCKQFR